MASIRAVGAVAGGSKAAEDLPSQQIDKRLKRKELDGLTIKAPGTYWAGEGEDSSKRTRGRRSSAGEAPEGVRGDAVARKKPPATPVQCSPSSSASTVKSSPAAEEPAESARNSSRLSLESAAKSTAAGKGAAGKGAVEKDANMADVEAQPDGEWRSEGSDYIGLQALRTMLDDNGKPVAAFGKIIGWLNAHESDFVSEVPPLSSPSDLAFVAGRACLTGDGPCQLALLPVDQSAMLVTPGRDGACRLTFRWRLCQVSGQAAALWHMVYAEANVGEEDLEEYEVKEALVAFCMSEANRCFAALREPLKLRTWSYPHVGLRLFTRLTFN